MTFALLTLERFYLTDDMLLEKQGAEVLAAAFSNHLAVLLRLTLPMHTVHRGEEDGGRICRF